MGSNGMSRKLFKALEQKRVERNWTDDNVRGSLWEAYGKKGKMDRETIERYVEMTRAKTLTEKAGIEMSMASKPSRSFVFFTRYHLLHPIIVDMKAIMERLALMFAHKKVVLARAHSHS